MRLLIDANLSPRVSGSLRQQGCDSTHVRDIGLLFASDVKIMPAAMELGAVLVTADTDFPMLLAMTGRSQPSVLLLRKVSGLSPEKHSRLLLESLPGVEESLVTGSVVTVSPGRVRIRPLPIE